MLNYLPRRRGLDRSATLGFLADHNPFYVLSAMFMLAGLFVLNDSLDWSPLPVGNMLLLIATLNLYEILLIGMACLLHARGVRRDATMLLVIEAFFLVDAGFLNSEIITQDLSIGLMTNVALIVAAAVKLAVVFRTLHLPIRSGPYLLAMLQLAVLLAMPAVFKAAAEQRDGVLPALALYGFWWMVGTVVALYGVMLGRIDLSDAPRIDPFGRHRVVVGAFLLLGFVSILAHLCTSNWIYNVRWHSANVGPVVLGLAVAVGSLSSELLRYRKRVHLQMVLPMGALLVSASFPSALEFGPSHLTPMTPLRLALLGSAIVYAHGLLRYGPVVFAWMSALCLLAASLGSSMSAMVENLIIANRAAGRALEALTPKRAVHWGVVSIVTSFGLLLIGLMLSLKKSRQESGA